MRWLVLLAVLAGCQGDESISAYATVNGDYAIVSLDGAPFEGATINVSEAGKVTGKAHCNTYFADQTAVYPWFELGPIGATRMACPNLASEAQFLAALREMTLVEALDRTLILSNTAGHEMVFQAP